jgi:hypothetical protein
MTAASGRATRLDLGSGYLTNVLPPRAKHLANSKACARG